MTSRIEAKYIVEDYIVVEIKERFLSLGAVELYPKRVISSIYLDNRGMKMFHDSEEGITPRKKIRLRRYPYNDDNYRLEEKVSDYHNRLKNSDPLSARQSAKILRHGFVDKTYGLIIPVCQVEYTRLYFDLKGIRFTIDSDIQYFRFSGMPQSLAVKDSACVIEAKHDSSLSQQLLMELTNSPTSRFSKYCRAIEALNLLR